MPTVAVTAIAWAEQASPTPSTVDLWFLGPVPTDVFAAWGQWAGGFGSILAVVVALGLAWGASKSAKEAATKAATEHRALRARTVVATIEERPFVTGAETHTVQGFNIANHGQTPVLEVFVKGIYLTTSQVPPGLGENGAFVTAFLLGDAPGHVVSVLGAGDEIFTGHAGVSKQRAAGYDAATEKIEVSFTFLDADGYRWLRIGNRKPRLIGEVKEVEPTFYIQDEEAGKSIRSALRGVKRNPTDSGV